MVGHLAGRGEGQGLDGHGRCRAHAVILARSHPEPRGLSHHGYPGYGKISPVAEPNRVETLERPVAEGEPLFLNRELSWLEFNSRVLHEAEDGENPLLERLKFIAIFDSNLDEFFMKRVGGLKQQIASNVRDLGVDGEGTPRQQLAQVNATVRPMVARQRRLLNQNLLPLLRQHGLEILSWDELRASERRHLCEEFDHRIFPVLTPLAVDPAHPFPFISHVSLSLAVAVKAP